MVMDSDIQVWLDTVERTQPSIVVPYVLSAQAQALRYRVRVVLEGGGNKAVIGQTGAIRLLANTPSTLSRFSLNRRLHERCEVEIILSGDDMRDLRYLLECPP